MRDKLNTRDDLLDDYSPEFIKPLPDDISFSS